MYSLPQPAQHHEAPAIAELIMLAMNHDCCQWFAGEQHSLDDFRIMLIELIEHEHSQYSYRNTIVVRTECGNVAGILVSYNGDDLLALRRTFIDAAQRHLQRDFSLMDAETQGGELYLDSLAVHPEHRCQGIATTLLRAGIERARQLHLPAVGLLVDAGNPGAEKLYKRIGFRHVDDTSWGGHPMHHLQFAL
ncbi:MAG: GNAT family N-acetyltransferase [Bacteroidaceae bacterium]|nr:GNAT family N-acetyltransferase [Bacteroidaceae bacterium]